MYVSLCVCVCGGGEVVRREERRERGGGGRERTGHESMYFDRPPFNLNPPSRCLSVRFESIFILCYC